MSRSAPSPVRFRPLALLAAVALALGFAPAGAVAAPATNQTILTLDPAIPIALDVAKVQLRTIGAARAGSAGIYLPVTRTNAKPGFIGTTRHQGGFEFVVAKRIRVGLRNPTVTIGKNGEGTLTAEPVVQGMVIAIPLPLGKLTLASTNTRYGLLDATYRLRVDKPFADVINGAVGAPILPAGTPWATLQTRIPAPAAPALK